MPSVRWYDVLFSGFFYMYASTQINNKLLKYFVFLVGMMALLFNLHNLLFFDLQLIKKPMFPHLIDKERGKLQIHRLYNLLIMYPLLYYASNQVHKNTGYIMKIMILIGFSYNFYYYLTYDV